MSQLYAAWFRITTCYTKLRVSMPIRRGFLQADTSRHLSYVGNLYFIRETQSRELRTCAQTDEFLQSFAWAQTVPRASCGSVSCPQIQLWTAQPDTPWRNSTPLLTTEEESPAELVPWTGQCDICPQPYTPDFLSFALVTVFNSWNYRPGLRVPNQLKQKNHKTSFTWLKIPVCAFNRGHSAQVACPEQQIQDFFPCLHFAGISNLWIWLIEENAK